MLNFALEKPTFRNFDREWMKSEFQRTGEWYGELYLNDDFGVLTVDENKKMSFFHRQVRQPLSLEIEKTDLPANSVFEVGRFVANKKMYLIFYDVLIHSGRRLASDRLARLKLLKSIVEIKSPILRPLQIDFWLSEYSLMLESKGTLVKKSALNYGIPYEDFVSLVKGMSIKNKKSFLAFPEKFQYSSEAFRLTLALDTLGIKKHP